MSTAAQPLHLVVGGPVKSGGREVFRAEELLAERAITEIVRSVRASAGTDDVPVDRLRAGDVSTNELAELLSPSLFADERVVVLESAEEAGKDAAGLISQAAEDVPPGTVLVVVHTGGGRAKALAARLRDLGAQVHPCAPITKPADLAGFVRAEFRAGKVKADEDTVAAVLETVGSDIRELAAACSQLIADTGGDVTEAAVRRYHSGRAEVSGYDIADKAVAGDIAGSAEALRWARAGGLAHVLVADALGEAVHAIARIAPLSGDPYQLAREVGMPSWRVQRVQRQSRRWTRERIGEAITVVAALNADVKGAAADADYALENAVRAVAEIAAGER